MEFAVITTLWAGLCALAGAGIVCSQIFIKRALARAQASFEDSINVFQYGEVFFDECEHFVMANEKARLIFPFFKAGETPPKSLSVFLNYMYDHAVEGNEDSILNTLNRTVKNADALGFREIILSAENCLCLAEVLKTQGGRTVLVVSDISDMVDREDHLLKLRRYNNELYQAIEAATNGLVITKHIGLNHALVFANKTFCEIFKMDKSEVKGASLIDIFSVLDDAETQGKIRTIMDQGQTDEVQFRLEGADRQALWYSLRLTPVTGEAGVNDMYVGVISDMTELKIRESEFFKAQKLEALGQLAAGVAHDFNNVLSIIDGYSRLAGNCLNEGDQAYDYTLRIRMASQRGADLIKQMLTFSRHKIVADSIIDLSQVVREQETLLGPLLDASIRLDIAAFEKNIFVECAADNIVQIIMNLAVNARDAMAKGGSLMIEVRKIAPCEVTPLIREKMAERPFACLSVSDTGSGMKKEVIERIFDPFYTTKEQGKGTGLGLSMVYGLVKQMGGCIDVRSVLNVGTTLFIYLPLSDKEPNRIVKGSLDDLSSLRLDGFTALVAEDEPDLLLLVSDMLKKLGMNVLMAANGSQALAMQDDYEGEIDILLTDVIMPEMNGLELSELVLSLRPETKLIFMSGYPASGQMARVQLPENVYFMAKPIQYETLARMIFKSLNEQSIDEEPSEFKVAQWKNGELALSSGRHK
jgi:two-component system cell cycle sensor histidine kinase/response regulator CckA